MRGIRKIVNIIVLVALFCGTILSPLSFDLKNPQKAKAVDSVDCGRTLTANFTLTENMACSSGDGLVVGADGITINGDGHTITGNGGYYDGISEWVGVGIHNNGGYKNVIVKNFAGITNFAIGIGFINSIGPNTIQDNTHVDSNTYYGIYLESSSSNTLIGNTTNSNTFYGIYLNSSGPDNIMTGNTANTNQRYGIYLSSSSSNTLTGNTLLKNQNDIYDDGTNIYSNNQFLHSININNKMLTFTEATRTKNLNDTVSFTFTAKKPNGTPCVNCTTITTSPSEASLTYIDNGSGLVTGSFIVTRSGTYSLTTTVTDSVNNVTKRNYLFFVNTSGSQVTKYYLRGVIPTHGQPASTDANSLLLTAPTSTETWECGAWVQNSPDEIPDYPLASLSGIDIYSWYKTGAEGYIGIQRTLDYWYSVDSSSTVPTALKYKWVNNNFTGLTWTMDYLQNWYLLSLKLKGSNPIWTTFPANADDVDPASWIAHHNNETGVTDPSYADFTYSYTTTPAIKSISNTDISVLSATAPVSDTSAAQIVLDGTGSTNIVLDSYKRPFSGYATTINSDGTATLAATGLSGETTINSVNMDITPNAGSIATNITTWNTGGDYSKTWTETGTGVTSADHVIGNLETDKYYTVSTGGWSNTYKAVDGKISFNYDGGYSTHTFNLTEDITPPVTEVTVAPNTTPDGLNGWYISAQDITLIATDSESGPGDSFYHWGTDGSYATYASPVSMISGTNPLWYYSVDIAGNIEPHRNTNFKLDLTLPTITVAAPSNNSYTTASTTSLTGSVTDAVSGISAFTINGVSVSNPGSFSTTVNLNLGLNTFTLTATDMAGNVTTQALTINRVAVSANNTNNTWVPSTADIIQSVVNFSSTFSIFDSSNDTNVTMSPDSTATFYTQYPIFSGHTLTYATVIIEIDGIPVEVTADANGDWQYKVTDPLAFGEHTTKITIKEKDTDKLLSENTYKIDIAEKANTQTETVAHEGQTNKKSDAWLFWMLGIVLVIILVGVGYKVSKKQS